MGILPLVEYPSFISNKRKGLTTKKVPLMIKLSDGRYIIGFDNGFWVMQVCGK
jgi:hypothetical protein